MQKKTAQALKRRHKARRLFNPAGKALTVLNPTFKKLIRDLDRLDKRVRKEAEDLNYYIGMARSFSRRRDYLTAATYLTKFHEKIKLINHQLKSFNADIGKDNRKFLLKNLKQKDKKQLFDYDPNKDLGDIKFVDDGFISTAGTLKDWWRVPGRFSDLYHNLSDKKSKSMRALERSFSDTFVSQLKEDTKRMLETTEELYKSLLENFNKMGAAWARRNIKNYVSEIQEINENYTPYHELFLKYYNNNILPMKEEQARQDAEEARRAERDAQEKQKALEKEKVFSVKPDPFPTESQKVENAENTIDLSSRDLLPNSLTEIEIADTHPKPLSSQETSQPSTFVAPTALAPSFVGPPTPKPTSNRPHLELVLDEESSGPKTLKSPINVTNPQEKRTFPEVTVEQKNPAISWRNAPKSNKPFSFNPSTGHNFDKGISELMSYDPDLKAKNDALKDTMKVNTHLDFIDRIEKLSTTQEIIREIINYSEEVEKYSEEDSLKLLAIAEGLIEKEAGAFDKIKKKLNKERKDQPKSEAPATPHVPTPPIPSPPIPSLDPETEDLEDLTPGTRRSPSTEPQHSLHTKTLSPGNVTKTDLLETLLPPKRYAPIEHGIPMGEVNKRWSDIPFLARKRAEDIKIGSNTANVIIKKIVKFLHHKYLPYSHIENFEEKFIQAIKRAITRGQLISNLACNDSHNGRDCQLSIFSYIRLEDIDSSPFFNGVVFTFKAVCRLSTFEGDITVRNISEPQLQNVGK